LDIESSEVVNIVVNEPMFEVVYDAPVALEGLLQYQHTGNGLCSLMFRSAYTFKSINGSKSNKIQKIPYGLEV
jgi:hypothetical protein